MINCGTMGVDWRDITWRGYCELLEEWNSRNSDGGDNDPERDAVLRKIMKARANV